MGPSPDPESTSFALLSPAAFTSGGLGGVMALGIPVTQGNPAVQQRGCVKSCGAH